MLSNASRPFVVLVWEHDQHELSVHVVVVHFEIRLQVLFRNVIGYVQLSHVQSTLCELEPKVGLCGVENLRELLLLLIHWSRLTVPLELTQLTVPLKLSITLELTLLAIHSLLLVHITTCSAAQQAI